MDCTNCSDVTVSGCSFSQMGGSGASFPGIAKRVRMAGLEVRDVSGNGLVVATFPNASAPFQSVDNSITDCVVTGAGAEFTGCCAIVAQYNIGLNLSHNTLSELPYGGISVGAGAA